MKKSPENKNDSSSIGQEALLDILALRFQKNMNRHEGLAWDVISQRILADPEKQKTLLWMEETGCEPDVIGFDASLDSYIFCDTSAETPAGRRSLCYDEAALASRKNFKPEHSAMGLATEMGIEMLTEDQYFELQKLGNFDQKSSSWLKTPPEIRSLGGALFGDCRYGRVFIYHNGAESYYSGRAFRGRLLI